WVRHNGQLRNCPRNFPSKSWPHYIPVLNSEGTIIDWRAWNDDWLENLPARNPRPILNGGFRGPILALIDEGYEVMSLPRRTLDLALSENLLNGGGSRISLAFLQ